MNENQIQESIMKNKEKLITYVSYYLSTLNEEYISEIKQVLDVLNIDIKTPHELIEE